MSAASNPSNPHPQSDAVGPDSFEPDYLAWREEQLAQYDRDYAAWRQAQARRHDEQYLAWRKGNASEEYAGKGNPGAATP